MKYVNKQITKKLLLNSKLLLAGLLAIGLLLITPSVVAQNEPSDATKRFFGFSEQDEGGGEWTMPDACSFKEEESRMQALSNEMQSLSNELNSIYQQQNVSDEQRQANDKRANEIQARMSQLEAEITKLSESFQNGPSDACKTAIVQQAANMMQDMLSKINERIPATLTKVDGVVTKVEAVLPSLAEAGVSTEKQAQLESDIASIKVQLGILRGFFDRMQNSAQSFINEANSNPLDAFDKMQNNNFGVSDAESGQAAQAADTMVKNFESIVSILDEITTEEQ